MCNYDVNHFCALFCHLLIKIETNKIINSDIYRTFLVLEARKYVNTKLTNSVTKLTNSVMLLKILIVMSELPIVIQHLIFLKIFQTNRVMKRTFGL